jgi:IS5 family transposase
MQVPAWYTILSTAANVYDVTKGQGLLHGNEKVVFADVGCDGATKCL